MSLANTADSLDQHLIDGLNYKLSPGGASYVSRRESQTLFPSSGNSFSSQGVRVCRIPITSSQWLDPTTAYLTFKINMLDTVGDTSTAGTRLELLGGQHAVWGRVRVLCGGQELEQLDHYPRLVTQ